MPTRPCGRPTTSVRSDQLRRTQQCASMMFAEAMFCAAHLAPRRVRCQKGQTLLLSWAFSGWLGSSAVLADQPGDGPSMADPGDHVNHLAGVWVPRIEPPGMSWGFSIGAQTRPGRVRIRFVAFATRLSDLNPAHRRPSPPLRRRDLPFDTLRENGAGECTCPYGCTERSVDTVGPARMGYPQGRPAGRADQRPDSHALSTCWPGRGTRLAGRS
jgi:hypothetical protein